MKQPIAFILRGTALAAGMAIASAHGAATILIDYDDGIPDNGIHDASIRNGGFEESDISDGATLPTIPFWNSYFSEGDGTNVLSTAGPANGVNRAFATGFNSTGNRIHPSQTIPASSWTIAAGDVFTFSVAARSGTGFTVGTHNLNLVIHVVDSMGLPVNDPINGVAAQDRIASSVLTGVNANWDVYSITSNPIAADSPWIGHQIQPRILNTGNRNSFMPIDNVFLSAIPEPATTTLLGVAAISLLRRRRSS